ncbi:MAG TPA: SDR family oxidoreductase [Candidatus Saccharimonadales bacterium]|jgi:dTDP-4-dehydrorhamnose reductase|nr:SDR family oxidoreductase [Candidatus Saccharimonadales bacterium]
MKKVLVIGASGMVASRFVDLAENKFEITPADEKIVDITDKTSVESYFDKNKFDSVINFAAFTNVDAAEVQRGDKEGLVWRLNVEGPENLAKICADKNIFLIHISTDFVFPGTEAYPGPYHEDARLPDTPDGMGWYGWTKNRAEFEIRNLGSRNAIIRYGYPFRAAKYDVKKDWARNLINLYNEHKLYPLFDDQIQSVLFVDDLLASLTKIVDEEPAGVFHISSVDTTTPYEIGKYLLEKYAGKPVEVEKGSMLEFLKTPGRTPRPRLGGLNNLNTRKNLSLRFNTWKEMADEFVAQL